VMVLSPKPSSMVWSPKPSSMVRSPKPAPMVRSPKPLLTVGLQLLGPRRVLWPRSGRSCY
jgi:hypothetical protein